MNEENNNNSIEKYQELLDQTPKEVREFLWSDAYKAIINGIKKAQKFSEEQTEAIDDVIFDLTIGAIGEAEAKNKMSFVKIDQTTQEKIFQTAYDYIISPAINKNFELSEEIKTRDVENEEVLENTENLEPNNKEEVIEENQTKIYKTTDTVLSNLNKKLNQSDSISTIERVHSQKNNQNQNNTTDSVRKIDPYREIPE